MKNGKWKYWIIPIILLVVIVVVGKSTLLANKQNQVLQATPPGVRVTVAQASYVQQAPTLSLTGSIEGSTSVMISAKMNGRIRAVNVENGQAVAAGQTLISLESSELANSVAAGNANVAKAQANYDNAVTDYNRYLTLYQKNAISRQQLDSAETRMKVAATDVQAANASLSSNEDQYSYASVTTPVAGVVANKTATVGQVVNAGLQLMTVESIGQVNAVVDIEQKDLGRIQIGQSAEVTVDTYPGRIFTGTVDIINPVAGNTNRMFRCKIKIDNSDGALKPGMFVQAQITAGQPVNALVIPQSAVYQKQGIYYAYTLEDGKAVSHEIKIGPVLGNVIAVNDGLTDGATVVTSNVTNLKDGDPLIVGQ